MSATVTIPDWLKTDPFACYTPNRVVFVPQRRITHFNAIPHLLDANDQLYPLHDCQPLTLEQITGGIASLVLENGETLTAYRDRSHRLGDGFVITDGKRKLGVAIEPSDPLAEVTRAAQLLAQEFNGCVVEDVDIDAD